MELKPGTWAVHSFEIKTVGPDDSSAPGFYEAKAVYWGATYRAYARTSLLAEALVLDQISGFMKEEVRRARGN